MGEIASESAAKGLVLLTGATGYVGGMLLPQLEQTGRPVRCLVRRPQAMAGRHGPRTELAQADLLAPDTLAPALAGADTAYYLVHSLNVSRFAHWDRLAAGNFAAAARQAGLKRIIYLGALGDPSEPLSPHLSSRQEVGDILRSSGVSVIEFRASIILGSGSISFEIMRALVRRLPVMITPRWVRSPCQPIAIEDVLAYLMAALDLELPLGESRIFEIGGADRLSYEELMREYARQRNWRRVMLPVPLLTPHLSSLWLGLIAPVHYRVGRRLVESLRHATVVHDPAAEMLGVRPAGVRETIQRILAAEGGPEPTASPATQT